MDMCNLARSNISEINGLHTRVEQYQDSHRNTILDEDQLLDQGRNGQNTYSEAEAGLRLILES
jgi:hypothetical protein